MAPDVTSEMDNVFVLPGGLAYYVTNRAQMGHLERTVEINAYVRMMHGVITLLASAPVSRDFLEICAMKIAHLGSMEMTVNTSASVHTENLVIR